MKLTTAVVLAALLAAGCGSEIHMPFSEANPTLPSNINIGTAERRKGTNEDQDDRPALGKPRNQGTRVWFVPVPAGDMLRLAKEPELWAKARERVDIFSFYCLHAYHHPGWECGTPCGPNTYQAFKDVVPGGMFKWVNDQGIQISVQTGAVKADICTAEKVRGNTIVTTIPIKNIEATGARVSFVEMDEPFFSGTNAVDHPGFGGCALSLGETAVLVKVYIDAVHEKAPDVQVGLIEPYPAMTVDEIISAILELERLGVRLPFFHLDMHAQAVVREHADVANDVRRIREFCRARGIPFGAIIFGEDGRTNEGYAEDAWATLRLIRTAVGVTEETVFQSWAESEPGNLTSRKFIPDTVPEANPATHTGQMLGMLEYLGVQPVR